jgi:hypothetical protein
MLPCFSSVILMRGRYAWEPLYINCAEARPPTFRRCLPDYALDRNPILTPLTYTRKSGSAVGKPTKLRVLPSWKSQVKLFTSMN